MSEFDQFEAAAVCDLDKADGKRDELFIIQSLSEIEILRVFPDGRRVSTHESLISIPSASFSQKNTIWKFEFHLF